MINLNQFQLHIFDLDDTLINTKAAYGQAQEDAVRRTFPNTPSQTINETIPSLKWVCQRFGSGNVADYLAAYFKMNANLFKVDDQTIERALGYYQNCFEKTLSCFADAVNYLNLLRESGKNIALVSNGHSPSQIRKLQITQLLPYFTKNQIYVSGNYPQNQKKPSPFMLVKACGDIGMSHRNSVFYGNSIDDIVAGNLAEIDTVHFAGSTPLPIGLPEIARPKAVYEDWSEIISSFRGG